MNKLRGPSEDTRRLLFLSSEGALLRMKWFFPRVIEGQVGATYLSARGWQKRLLLEQEHNRVQSYAFHNFGTMH